MSFSDRTMTEPYTSREVSTVPGEGDANLLLQDSKAAAPYSTLSMLRPLTALDGCCSRQMTTITAATRWKNFN